MSIELCGVESETFGGECAGEPDHDGPHLYWSQTEVDAEEPRWAVNVYAEIDGPEPRLEKRIHATFGGKVTAEHVHTLILLNKAATRFLSGEKQPPSPPEKRCTCPTVFDCPEHGERQ